MSKLGTYTPRGDRRIIYVSDPDSIIRFLPGGLNLPEIPTEDFFRNWVDDVAEANVDTFIQEAYSQGWTLYWRCEKFDYDQRPQHRCFIPLLDAGVQPLEILIDQSHKRGMEFIAGFRMNLNHVHVSTQQGVGGGASYLTQDSRWMIKEYPPGDYFKINSFLDFTFQEVRDYICEVAIEIVRSFDLDGLELCFREPVYFPHGKGRESQSIMTDLMRQIHEILVTESQIKKKELKLGARVFQTLKECHDLGLDIPTWIEKGYLDYVSPSDVMYSDINAPYEEFTDLTRDSNCYLYPAILPWLSCRSERRLNRMPINMDQQRAIAQNYYGAGADGISFYNHFVSNDWANFYPMQLFDMDELRDPVCVREGRKNYVYEPIWSGCDVFIQDGAPSGAIKADKILLKRSGNIVSDNYRFRLCEDLNKVRKAYLIFRAGNMTLDDQIKVFINNEEIPRRMIRQTQSEKRIKAAPIETNTDRSIRLYREGKIKEAVKNDITIGDTFKHDPLTVEKGHPIIQGEIDRPFTTCWFELTTPPAIYGDNWLEVTLIEGDPQAIESIIIDELEVMVV